MHIQMVTDRYFPAVGGAERQLALLASVLDQRGHSVRIVTRRLHEGLRAHETIDGIDVVRLRPIGLSKAANALIIPRLITYLVANRKQYDIIHSQSLGPIGIAAIISGQLLNKPVFLRVATAGDIARQEVRTDISAYTRFIRRYVVPTSLWRSLLRRATGIIALSTEITAEAHAEKINAAICQIPNGVDVRTYYPPSTTAKTQLRHRFRLGLDNPILITSGRLVARKRIDVAISTMPAILRDFPGVRLLIAGTGRGQADSVEAKLREQVQQLGLTDAVLFLGLVDNIADYLRAADVFVFPSENEGMPNALLEAMAVGLPAVVSNIGGVQNIVVNDEARLVAPGDVPALSQALLELLHNPNEAQHISRAAHERIIRHFSIDAVATQYETLYQQILMDPQSDAM